MKTFKWTVPELPMTDREKNPSRKVREGRPGLGWLISGFFFSLMSLMYFSISNGFIKGIRSYFWASGDGTILSSDLRAHTRSGSGTVTYSILIDGVPIEDTAEVFKRWSGDPQLKFDEWSSQYARGNSATIYYNQSGETSLGHWPAEYSYQFGIQGVTTLFVGLSFIYRGAKKLNAAQATPDGAIVL